MKKKAEDLKPGDVVVTPSHRLVITQVDKDGFVWAARSGEPYAPLANIRFQEEVEVEAPTITPAQQHAEELLDILRDYGRCSLSGWEGRVLDLLARIDPPKPPSAEELAEALRLTVDNYIITDDVKKVLARARAAGLLKGE